MAKAPVRKNVSEENATKLIDELGHIKDKIDNEIKDSAGQFVEVEIGSILSPKYHDRRWHDKMAIVELSKSIEAVGLIYPVVLRKLESGLERVIGFRRIEAFKHLDRQTIPAIILDNVSDEMAILLMATENMQREDISVYDETLAVIDYIKAATGDSQEQIEKLLYRFKNNNANKIDLKDEEKEKYFVINDILKKTGKLDVSGLLNRLGMLAMHPIIKEALSQNRLSFTNAQLLQKLSGNDEYLAAALKRVEEEGSSKRETAKIVGEYLDSPKIIENEIIMLNEKIKKIKARGVMKLPKASQEKIQSHLDAILELIATK